MCYYCITEISNSIYSEIKISGNVWNNDDTISLELVNIIIREGKTLLSFIRNMNFKIKAISSLQEGKGSQKFTL